MTSRSMIVGIDPSTSATGVVYGIGNREASSKIFSKRGKLPKGMERFEILEDLVARISDHVQMCYPKAIYIEHYFAAMRNGVQALYEFGALLRWELMEIAPVIEVSTTALKKFATGKGNSPKSVCAAHIAKRYQVEFSSDDLYDAYGLWRLGRVHQGIDEPANQKQREVIEALSC